MSDTSLCHVTRSYGGKELMISCMHACVCIHVCMQVCMYVGMYACTYVCVWGDAYRKMHTPTITITISSPSPSSSTRKDGGFLASSPILPTCSAAPTVRRGCTRPKTPMLITSHAKSVVNIWNLRQQHIVCCSHLEKSPVEHEEDLQEDIELQVATETQQSLGVAIALALLCFYRNEISPFLPRTCRYVPSCSEYSMQAYRTYGVTKGTILTAWRLIRCNPFGSSGFDPPRWFGESKAPIS